MKLLKQFLIILAISFVGEILKYLLPLPVPASIYGMVILFIGLLTGLIPLNSVRSAGKFMIEIMPVMFIPAGVGLMSSWGNLKPVLVPVTCNHGCGTSYCNDCYRICFTARNPYAEAQEG